MNSKPVWISALIIVIVAVVIITGILIYKNVKKPLSSPPPLSLEEYKEMTLTNDHNKDIHLYYFENDGNKFYTVIDGIKYIGTYNENDGNIQITSPTLLKYIQDQIPVFCNKPQSIPIFTPVENDNDVYTSFYDLGFCGKVTLTLSNDTN